MISKEINKIREHSDAKTLWPGIPLILLFLISNISGFCQEITFNKVLPPNTNSWQHVTGITQDKNGTMWFATKIGLYSYNGYEMKSYKHDPLNPASIASDILETVSADQDGNIWVGTLGYGLDKFDPETGIFNHYRDNPDNPGRFTLDYISTTFVDKENILWVGTGIGLSRYDAETDEFIHYRNIAGDSTSLSDNEVITIYEDSEGTIWVGTGSVYSATKNDFEAGGLNKMDRETGKFERFKHDPKNPNSLINNKVSAIFEDSKGTLWIGTAGDGLHTMDKSSGKITRHRYDPANPEKLSRPPLSTRFTENDHISFIIEDATGLIWIGASDAGLSYYNPELKKTTHVRNQKYEGGYNDRTAWAGYTSRDGVLWISSIFGRLYRIDPLRTEIPHVDVQGHDIESFYHDKTGTLWWGSDKIYVSGNKYEKLIQKINHDLQQATKNFNWLKVIQEDSEGNILIGSGGGLIKLNLTTQKYTHYVQDPDNNNTISNNNITAVSEDSNKNLWIGTLRGLNRLDPATGNTKRYYVDIENTALFGNNVIRDVQVDNKDRIWVAMVFGNGVGRLNEKSGEFEIVQGAFMGNCLFIDSKGTLWAGTNDGLYYYDSATDTFVKYKDLNALNEITSVENIIEDDNHNLWISAGTGIMQINTPRTDTKSYGTNYGVYPEILTWNTGYKDRDGFLYFSDNYGYYKFMPSEITTNSKPPQIEITDFQIADQEENTLVESEETFLDKKEFSLAFNQNTFSFDFAVIDYSDPEANQHLFMLENYDDNWRKANAKSKENVF
jgi:ligand-binding sensor domain-containing protein